MDLAGETPRPKIGLGRDQRDGKAWDVLDARLNQRTPNTICGRTGRAGP